VFTDNHWRDVLTSFTLDIEIFCWLKDYAGCIMYSSLQQSK